MSAEVVKLPKRYREAQRWRAECQACPPRPGLIQEYWMSYPSRTAGVARYLAKNHNNECHT